MIDYTAPIYSRPDGTYVATVNGYPYHIIDGDPLKDEVESYLAKHPEALIPEPVPPEPSAEELERIRVAGIQAQLDALDRKAIRPLRAIAAGTATQADRDRLADLEAQADVIRTRLA